MITVSIEPEIVEKAKTLYPFDNLNGSITKGKSQLYGAIGELLVYDLFLECAGGDKSFIDFTSTYDYDMVVVNRKIDVKTKRTTVEPKPYYLCSISAFNINQQCDDYFFVRVHENLETAYLLGSIPKNKFFEKATFRKKGESDINGWKFKDDCYNLEIQELIDWWGYTDYYDV